MVRLISEYRTRFLLQGSYIFPTPDLGENGSVCNILRLTVFDILATLDIREDVPPRVFVDIIDIAGEWSKSDKGAPDSGSGRVA